MAAHEPPSTILRPALPLSPFPISSYFRELPLAAWPGGFDGADAEPWHLVAQIRDRLPGWIRELDPRDHRVEHHADGDVAVHRLATIEPGAVLKGPLVVEAGAFVAAGAYLRGGNWIGAGASVGPGVELKTCIVMPRARLAHFNFVGDSIVGAGANLEAGSIVCNHRNERGGGEVRVRIDGALRGTGCTKFGALIGDGARIGANAVLAPGCLVPPGGIVGRCALVDPELGEYDYGGAKGA